MDSAALAKAVEFADSRNRLNVQIFRHNCLVASGSRNRDTNHAAWNIWSVTKSVVSLVAGAAIDEGKLDPEAPIDRYLPQGIGDKAHREIRVVDLLTETSGMKQAVASEGITGIVPVDPNSAMQALGMPMVHKPGTVFIYSQRTVDLLTYVVQNALGEPFQIFAQRKLFDPMGIRRSDYYWARDRSGNTYGYAHLMMPPDDMAKIGLLLSNNGRWGDQQLISTDYLQKATTPSAGNPCYGYLIWLATSQECGEPGGILPKGSFATSGMLGQHMFILPSLGLMISWTGIGGSRSSQGLVGQFQNAAELGHNFFRLVYAAIRDVAVPDPGAYVEPPLAPLRPGDFVQPDIGLAIFGIGPAAYPGCNIFSCLGKPLALPFSDLPPGCLILICLPISSQTPGIK